MGIKYKIGKDKYAYVGFADDCAVVFVISVLLLLIVLVNAILGIVL